MTTGVQNPSTALDGASLAVRAFVEAHELAEHLANAVRLGEECFPPGSTLSLRVEGDPECPGEWVVMDWQLPAATTVDEAVGGYRRLVRGWNALTPPWVGNVMRITFCRV